MTATVPTNPTARIRISRSTSTALPALNLANGGGLVRRTRVVARPILTVAVVALLAVEAETFRPYVARATEFLGRTDPRWLALAVVSELLSMETFARVQRRMLIAGGAQVSRHAIVALSYAANALSVTLPGGTAISASYAFRRLRTFGVAAPTATFALVAAGAMSTVSFALIAAAAAMIFGAAWVNLWMLVVGLILVAGSAYATRRLAGTPSAHRLLDNALAWGNRVLRRPEGSGYAAVHEFMHGLRAIRPRRREWGLSFASATGNWLADLACLAASLRAVGADVSPQWIILTFLAGATASGLSFLPGGIGIVDAAMLVPLTHAGVHIAPAIAAVVLYRLISFVLIAILGWVAWGTNWRTERSTREDRHPGQRFAASRARSRSTRPTALGSRDGHRNAALDPATAFQSDQVAHLRPSAAKGDRNRFRRTRQARVPAIGTTSFEVTPSRLATHSSVLRGIVDHATRFSQRHHRRTGPPTDLPDVPPVSGTRRPATAADRRVRPQHVVSLTRSNESALTRSLKVKSEARSSHRLAIDVPPRRSPSHVRQEFCTLQPRSVNHPDSSACVAAASNRWADS